MRNIRFIVDTQCEDCDGTGIHRGFMDSLGLGVVCRECKGSGKKVIQYKPFMGRKTRDDIQIVRFVKEAGIGKDTGPETGEITYQEFLDCRWPGLTEDEVREMVELQSDSEIVRTRSVIDFEMFEHSLQDGTADEYIERVQYLSAEGLLEEQGDERVWLELTDTERELIAVLLRAYAESKGYYFQQGDDHCMVSMHR